MALFRNSQLSKFFAATLLTSFVGLNACSSDEEAAVEEGGGGETPDAAEAGTVKAKGKGKKGESGLELEGGSRGLLGFVNPERGLAVTAIQWDQPIGQENPGADCELRAAKKPGVYTCVVKEGALVAILNITEAGAADAKHISRITLDGKGAPTWKRWLKELKDNGYVPAKGAKVAPGRTAFISGDGNTRADVVWAAAAQAVTIILKPAKGS